MVRTDTSLKLMGLLLNGEAVSDSQLAATIGFTNPRNIIKHLDSFVNLGYIRALPRDAHGPDHWFQLTDKKEGILKLYQSTFYRGLRVKIREIPWFIDEMAEGFRNLPPDLFLLIREMMQMSHTFFSILARHPQYERLLSAYSLYLFPCRLIGHEDPHFQSYYLYAQIYSEAITRDIEQGGLAEGFLTPLDTIQKALLQMKGDTTMTVLPCVRGHSPCRQEDHGERHTDPSRKGS